MPSLLLHRLGMAATAVVLTAGATGAALAVAPAANADPVPAYTTISFRPIVADVTGDRIADRLTLGYLGEQSARRCAVSLSVGLGHGVFGAPTVADLPVRATTVECPGVGTVLAGPTAAQNRLAVTFFEFPPSVPSLGVQLFGWDGSRFVTRGHLAGIYQPSVIGSQDFDGDGWGDLWESTDQGDGFQAFVGRPGSQWRQLYATPFTTDAREQFFDLNHAGGTDILVTWDEFGRGSGVAAVDGKTGAVQVLASATPDAVMTYRASLVDIDHNALPDIKVSCYDADGTETTQWFVNRSSQGRWAFRLQAA